MVSLTNRKYLLSQISTTFHGRDLFAPVAGHLSLGVEPKDFGKEVNSWTELIFRKPRVEGKKLMGEVLHIDAFGNLISNIDEGQFLQFVKDRPFIVKVGKKIIRGLRKGYWEVKKGEASGPFRERRASGDIDQGWQCSKDAEGQEGDPEF